MRLSIVATVIGVLATPALSDDHAHLADVDGLRVLHAWTVATAQGADALIYAEVQNTTDTAARLTGGRAMDQVLDLVGFAYRDAKDIWTVLPDLPVPPKSEIHLEPKVMALRWSAIPAALAEGDDLTIGVILGGAEITVDVEVGAPDAIGHSHAGHDH